MLKTCAVTMAKLVWGIYLVLTSIYCLLAFLPYTYYALIKAPAYEWMPWFVQHHAGVYWMTLAAAAVAVWPRKKIEFLAFGLLTLAGIYLTLHPFMPGLQSGRAAYVWSLMSLLPLLITMSVAVSRWETPDRNDDSCLGYSTGILVAIMVAVLYVAGVQVRSYAENHSTSFHLNDLALTTWSVLSHILLAIIVVTILNLVRLAASRTSHPVAMRTMLTGLLVCAGLWLALVRFLNHALSFEGWMAQLYAISLAATLTLFGFSLAGPWLTARTARGAGSSSARKRIALLCVIGILAVLAMVLPWWLHNSDWNGVLEGAFTVGLWTALGVCMYSLRPRPRKYSLATILGILVLAVFSYKALQYGAIFWAQPLGSTDDDISRSLETYAGQDASFQLAHHLLGNAPKERCGDLCRILREYTNIRDVRVQSDINLVEPLEATTGEHPNIFVFVIDSLRPDYLGAYNSQVDFTPNLDAFARDSVVLHRAFTQYAGTTLSEPAIWAGMMLPHTHYVQPFHRVNGLEKLALADGYQMIVSYDTVLSQLLSPSDDLLKLDTDKPLWNRFEACSTIQQTEQALDTRADKSRPVLFYAQPMNVHQFAHNDLPLLEADHWRMRPGFSNRIAHEVHQVDGCLGSFFAYLKQRGLYDNSIIVVTSDHGDATGQYGRFSHSLSLFPEIMRVPLIVHLPPTLRRGVVYDDSRVSTLTDLTPSLYYLLGHRPIRNHPLFGRPLFAASREELEAYRRDEFFLASDVHAVYGILADNGRFLYFTYDSPPQSYLFDLASDPGGERNLASNALKKQYDRRIIEDLQAVGDFYGYRPGVESLLASTRR